MFYIIVSLVFLVLTIPPQSKSEPDRSKTEELLKSLQTEVATNPSPDAFNKIGSLHFQIGNYKSAIEAHRQAILINPQSITPESIAAFNFLNNIANKIGLHMEVIEVYKEVIRLNPEHPIAYGSLGYSYAALKQYREATEAYEQSIRIKPHDGMLYFKVGEAYLALGSKDDARRTYDRLKELCAKEETDSRKCIWGDLAEKLLKKIEQ